MKNYLKLLFTFLMAFCVVNIVSAETTYKVDIKNTDKGHTYEAYQIFTGDLSQDKTTLSNIKWGNGVLASFTKDKNAYEYAKSIKADPVAKSIELGKNLSEVKAGETSTYKETTVEGKTIYVYTISGLVPGYYLIKDKDDSQAGKNDAYTEFIVKLVDDEAVTTKTGKPTADKKIDEGNGVTKSSNYAVGDTVKYILTGTMPSNYNSYNIYAYTFHDTLSKGLTLDEDSVKVYVDGKEITAGFEVKTSTVAAGTQLDIVFANTKRVTEITKDSVVTVKYNATVNTNAVRGTNGNKNTLNIEFSNNPNSNETGKTPDIITTVYVFDLILNKIDSETKEALKGAGFTLTRISDKRKWVIENLDGNEFKFAGLSAGEYTLEETTVPDKYNKLDTINFTITPEYDEETGALKDLSITDTGYTFTVTVAAEAAELEADIPNVKGVELPLTGGMGSIIFTVIGTILMAVAAIGFLRNKEEK